MRKVITQDLQLSEIDKLHHVGKVKEKYGKKCQDVIVRFKSHSARCDVMKARKKAKHMEVSSNQTKQRSSLLFKASEILKDIDKVSFAFANIHSDLNIRVIVPYIST